MPSFLKAEKTNRPDPALVQDLYGGVSKLARAPVFYTRFGVPDTTDGRYDLLCLSLSLYLFRIQTDAPDLAQALFDLTFKDTERGLREAGVGDLGIPKHMKKMLQVFYGRAALYYDALEQGDSAALAAVLQKNLYNGATEFAAPMAEWVRIAWDYMRSVPMDEILDEPASVLALLPPQSA